MELHWKEIEGYESYLVSTKGQVFSSLSNKLLQPKIRKNDGRKQVSLYNYEGKRTSFLVHRLVACAFIQNPHGLPEVNHKDENYHNNTIDNLEWCSRDYNINYGTRVQRMSETLRSRNVSDKLKAKRGGRGTGVCTAVEGARV